MVYNILNFTIMIHYYYYYYLYMQSIALFLTIWILFCLLLKFQLVILY